MKKHKQKKRGDCNILRNEPLYRCSRCGGCYHCEHVAVDDNKFWICADGKKRPVIQEGTA